MSSASLESMIEFSSQTASISTWTFTPPSMDLRRLN